MKLFYKPRTNEISCRNLTINDVKDSFCFNTRMLQGSAFIVPFSDQAFDSNGKLIDLKQKEALTSLMVRLRQEISLVRGL